MLKKEFINKINNTSLIDDESKKEALYKVNLYIYNF